MSFGKDVGIGKPLQSLIAEMNCIVLILSQPVHDPPIHAHVRQELHRRLRGLDLFLGKPRSIFDCLLDICALQVGIPF